MLSLAQRKREDVPNVSNNCELLPPMSPTRARLICCFFTNRFVENSDDDPIHNSVVNIYFASTTSKFRSKLCTAGTMSEGTHGYGIYLRSRFKSRHATRIKPNYCRWQRTWRTIYAFTVPWRNLFSRLDSNSSCAQQFDRKKPTNRLCELEPCHRQHSRHLILNQIHHT